MCLILFAAGVHARYALVVAANRDEAYARPAAPLHFWDDHPQVCAGRDLEQGGTWLGFARTGRFAAITNYRQGTRIDVAPRSRGELTRDFLTGDSSAPEYLGRVSSLASEYHGYSLILGGAEGLYFHSNRGSVQGPVPIAPGLHGLSNRSLDEPWPKVRHGICVLGDLLQADESTLTSGLFDMLADRTIAPDELLPSTGITVERERDLSPAFIAGDVYGTRASTVLLVNSEGEVVFCERTFGPHGVLTGTTEVHFHVERPPTIRGRAPTAA